jgi:type II secretory pathway predicted ATPase ExeA
MYRHHFGLREKPFQIAPSPRFLFPSETHDESRARILYGIEDNRGFVVVYGRVGLGKTTVLLSVLEELDAKTRTALLYQPISSFHDLLRMTAHEFGLGSENRDEVNLIWDLNEFFIQRLSESEKCVLIVDEAQNLSLEILEKLRTLSNLQTESASLLQIVLVGQPELYDKLSDPRLLQLRQRVGVWHEIESLNREETTDYILHRLQRAGARRPKEIFSVRVCERVHELTGGVPRVINQVCDTALMIAYGKESPQVEVEDVVEAAHELHLVEEEPKPRETQLAKERPTEELKKSPVWARLSFAAVILLVVLGAIWIFFGGNLRLALRGDRMATGSGIVDAVAASPATDSTAAAQNLPAVQKEEMRVPKESGKETPATSPGDEISPERMERMKAHLENVRSLRAAGKPVYTVHLNSFKEVARAQEFASDIAREQNWEQPVFMERSGRNPVWYRVFAGEFGRSRDALAWIEQLKVERRVVYANLQQLSRDVEVLVPTEPDSRVSLNGVDG